jgi:Ca-activated chloride channel family protein
VVDHVPANLPDVFEGSPLVAAVALAETGGTLVVRGDLATGRWEQTVKLPALAHGSGDPAIVALYGRERVADFEARWNESLDAEIEATGLAYQIATRMTSWIAVDKSRKVTGPSRGENVPQELPFGTRAESFGLRGGDQLELADLEQGGFLGLEQERASGTMAGVFKRRAKKSEMAKESRISTKTPAMPIADIKQRLGGKADRPAPKTVTLAMPDEEIEALHDPAPAKPVAPMQQPSKAELIETAKKIQGLPVRSRSWLVWLFVLAVIAALLAWWLI